MEQIYRNIKNCCISLYRPPNQYIFVRLQIKYRSSWTKFGRKLEIWTKFWTKLVLLDGWKMTFWTTYFLCPYWLCQRNKKKSRQKLYKRFTGCFQSYHRWFRQLPIIHWQTTDKLKMIVSTATIYLIFLHGLWSSQIERTSTSVLHTATAAACCRLHVP